AAAVGCAAAAAGSAGSGHTAGACGTAARAGAVGAGLSRGAHHAARPAVGRVGVGAARAIGALRAVRLAGRPALSVIADVAARAHRAARAAMGGVRRDARATALDQPASARAHASLASGPRAARDPASTAVLLVAHDVDAGAIALLLPRRAGGARAASLRATGS